jgi:peptide/nickel transport system permease protein
MLLTLFGISVLIFVMLRLVPGNITDIIFDSAGFVNPVAKKKIEQQLGLDNHRTSTSAGSAGWRVAISATPTYEKPAIDEILPYRSRRSSRCWRSSSVLFGVPWA